MGEPPALTAPNLVSFPGATGMAADMSSMGQQPIPSDGSSVPPSFPGFPAIPNMPMPGMAQSMPQNGLSIPPAIGMPQTMPAIPGMPGMPQGMPTMPAIPPMPG